MLQMGQVKVGVHHVSHVNAVADANRNSARCCDWGALGATVGKSIVFPCFMQIPNRNTIKKWHSYFEF